LNATGSLSVELGKKPSKWGISLLDKISSNALGEAAVL